TADKPDSQEVCFVTTAGGREALLGSRIPLHRGRVVDTEGRRVGEVDAIELVTVGQRRGLGTGAAGSGDRRFALAVDPVGATVVVGPLRELDTDRVDLTAMSWVGAAPPAGPVDVQCSAHGAPFG